MNPADTDQVRVSILRYLQAAGPRGLTADVLMASLNDEGWQVSAVDTSTQTHYLMQRGLVLQRVRDVDRARPRWAITADGMDALVHEQSET